jgi:hypothetical protein
MGAFEDLHRGRVAGSLAMFDRMIFKGHLSGLYKGDNAPSRREVSTAFVPTVRSQSGSSRPRKTSTAWANR